MRVRLYRCWPAVAEPCRLLMPPRASSGLSVDRVLSLWRYRATSSAQVPRALRGSRARYPLGCMTRPSRPHCAFRNLPSTRFHHVVKAQSLCNQRSWPASVLAFARRVSASRYLPVPGCAEVLIAIAIAGSRCGWAWKAAAANADSREIAPGVTTSGRTPGCDASALQGRQLDEDSAGGQRERVKVTLPRADRATLPGAAGKLPTRK